MGLAVNAVIESEKCQVIEQSFCAATHPSVTKFYFRRENSERNNFQIKDKKICSLLLPISLFMLKYISWKWKAFIYSFFFFFLKISP